MPLVDAVDLNRVLARCLAVDRAEVLRGVERVVVEECFVVAERADLEIAETAAVGAGVDADFQLGLPHAQAVAAVAVVNDAGAEIVPADFDLPDLPSDAEVGAAHVRGTLAI